MKEIFVSKDCWSKCFNFAYDDSERGTGSTTLNYLYDTYGIEYWHAVDLDQYRVRFSDEKKMIHWMLRWS